jgi:flagellar basal-body rod protein FlgG
MGSNLFTQTPASGDPVVSNPNVDGFGSIKQNYLESSNVDPVKEITELITAQRAYEMNSKVITTADDMASVVSKNLK